MRIDRSANMLEHVVRRPPQKVSRSGELTFKSLQVRSVHVGESHDEP
jgi:hypothetical protein